MIPHSMWESGGQDMPEKGGTVPEAIACVQLVGICPALC